MIDRGKYLLLFKNNNNNNNFLNRKDRELIIQRISTELMIPRRMVSHHSCSSDMWASSVNVFAEDGYAWGDHMHSCFKVPSVVFYACPAHDANLLACMRFYKSLIFIRDNYLFFFFFFFFYRKL